MPQSTTNNKDKQKSNNQQQNTKKTQSATIASLPWKMDCTLDKKIKTTKATISCKIQRKTQNKTKHEMFASNN